MNSARVKRNTGIQSMKKQTYDENVIILYIFPELCVVFVMWKFLERSLRLTHTEQAWDRDWYNNDCRVEILIFCSWLYCKQWVYTFNHLSLYVYEYLITKCRISVNTFFYAASLAYLILTLLVLAAAAASSLSSSVSHGFTNSFILSIPLVCWLVTQSSYSTSIDFNDDIEMPKSTSDIPIS